MTDQENPRILTYRFHEFRPSDRKELRRVLAADGGRDAFVAALDIYLQKWAKADWLTEYDLERIAQWTALHFPDVAKQVEEMAARELSAAQMEQAKKTYATMSTATKAALHSAA
ncbi:hypothetical protein [Pseudooceanicola sp.]|uniref:hypothetical protein n=1 Tax=Pseudooceanicola sp. TaxID=1914328 RepID=UPI0035149042